MRGYPKHLNTKTDFQFVREHFDKAKWLPELKKLLASYQDWAFVKLLDSEEDGVVDETHRVLDVSDDPNAGPMFAQYEFRVNDKARIFRLGFTVDEVQKMVAEAEAGA